MNPINKLAIIYEDEHIIVCKKPAGVATQSRNVRVPDMETLIKKHLYCTSALKKEPYLAVIHRLDQPVSGILVFAKTPLAAKNLNQQLQSRGFGKHYKAVLTSNPPIELVNKPLIHYMKKDSSSNTSIICGSKDTLGKKASLTYQIIKNPTIEDLELFHHCNIPQDISSDDNFLTFVHIVLDTGRHHQIRVQMSHLGCPIWGDTKYGNTSPSSGKWEQIALCAYKLEFKHPITHKPLSYEL